MRDSERLLAALAVHLRGVLPLHITATPRTRMRTWRTTGFRRQPQLGLPAHRNPDRVTARVRRDPAAYHCYTVRSCRPGLPTSETSASENDRMPPGDASRTWFPEIVDQLRELWSDDLDAAGLIRLATILDRSLQNLRSTRKIEPAMMWCRHCQKRHRSSPPRVSVRAAILAALRFEVTTPEATKKMERQWKKHRRTASLDRFGQPLERAIDP